MKKLRLNKSYDWQAVLKFASENNMEVEELGADCLLGESFMILRDFDHDKIISLVMTSYNSATGASYKVVYSDLAYK